MNDKIEIKNDMIMKLLHYFITKRGYTPVVLHGAKDEIWLENMDEEYKLIRIASNYLHNDEQLKFDIFKTKKIMGKIKRKTFSFKMKMMNIYINLGESVNLEDEKDIEFAYIKKNSDFKKYKNIIEMFPNIMESIKQKEKGTDLFLKVTKEINAKGAKDSIKTKKIFEPETPYLTYFLMAVNIAFYFGIVILEIGNPGFGEAIFNKLAYYYPFILNGEYFRLFTSMFLHGNIIHLGFNMYALYIIGNYIENYYGKAKYIAIYIFGGIFGNLLSMLFLKEGLAVGASGAIFALLGAFVYFGYHHRKILGTVLKSQILPIILINLFIGFMLVGINNVAHIGGLIGGGMISVVLGVTDKTSNTERINGIIATIIMTLVVIYMGFFM